MNMIGNKSVSLLAWGYNEELNIEKFYKKAISLLESTVSDFEIIYIDDGSTDNSYVILESLAINDSRLKVFRNKENRNVGYSCKKAISLAKKDYLFWQTVDWSYDIAELNIFLNLLDRFDIVQGVRVVPDRILSHIPIIRSLYRVRGRSDNLKKAIISLTNYYVLKILFRAPLDDFQNVTFYKTRYIQSLEITANTPFINPEMIIKSYLNGKSIIEVPINFIPRELGSGKGSRLKIVLKTVFDIVKGFFTWRLFYVSNKKIQKINRISNPFQLDLDILTIVLPLFKKFKYKG
jgi:glycosyltransferase involved in cell wall biosynthesis